MIKSFLLALQFLTILPVEVGKIDEQKLARSAIFFPLVGILLGWLLISINNILSALNFPQLCVDIIIVVALIILTAGIHLDGLSDTFDGLFSGKDKEGMLAIMRDSHAGVMGILAIISVVLLKIALLYSISAALKPLALLLICVLSRWSMVFYMFLFPYARQEGKAKTFVRGMNREIFILATLIALVSVWLVWNLKGIFILFIAAAFTWAFGKIVRDKIGGLTGDTVGALNEIMEVTLLLSICLTKGMRVWIG